MKPLSFAQLRSQLEKLVATKNAKSTRQTMSAQFQKPENLDKNAMSCTQKESTPSQPDANDAKSSNSEAAVWNRNAALDALDNDAEVFKSLVQVLADELNERLAALDAALTVGDEEQLRRTAHACKNSAGIMRLDQLRAAAAEAESADSSCLPEAAAVLRKAIIEARNILAAEQKPEESC